MISNRCAVIVSIGFSPRSLQEVLSLIHKEAQKGCDLILLPETCLGNDAVVPTDGEAVLQVASLAAQYHTYILFPVFRQGGSAGRLNSAILIDRNGQVAGTYDKVFPYWAEFDFDPPSSPGLEAPVFLTDFGKVGIAICFDANFPEVFEALAEKGAELVLWPSAYSAGMSLQAHAINYNYHIVTCTSIPDCLVYDNTGREVSYQSVPGGVNVSRVVVDMDRCVFHQNFNIVQRDQLLREHSGEIEQDSFLEREQWFTLRSIKPGVSARLLAQEYGMEELRQYKRRSRREIDRIRGFCFAEKNASQYR